MEVELCVRCLYSDDDYTLFVQRSCELFVLDLITEEELFKRFEAVKRQIEKQ